MLKITLQNIKSKIETDVPTLRKLREDKAFCFRVKGAFFSPAFKRRQWDGKFRFITEKGLIDTGLIPKLVNKLKEDDIEYKIIDNRQMIYPKYKVNRLRKFTLRGYQQDAVESVGKSKLDKLHFPICNINAATNAGKTLISAGIYRMYSEPTIFFINSTDLLNEALRELPQYIPNEVGYIVSGKPIEWQPFMIVMVKTFNNRVKDTPELMDKLKYFKVVLIDEGDLATSKTYKNAISATWHCPVRVGLSGTMWTPKDDKLITEKLRALFGREVYKIKNIELQELGHSSLIDVTIVDGNQEIEIPGDYDREYRMGITDNKHRHMRIAKRVKYHLSKGHKPILIFCQYHDHVENVYKVLHKAWNHVYRVAFVHDEVKRRNEIVEDFRDGKIEILVASYILKRGKNLPLTQYVLNAAGGKSMTNVLQGPIGRAVRKHESKKLTYVEDMWDIGYYLNKHSKKRRLTYKNEGFPVNDEYTI